MSTSSWPHVVAHMLACAASGQDLIASLAKVGEDLEELASKHNQAKQRGLYADLINGSVWEPASISKSEAQRMLGTVCGLLDHGGYLADPEFIAWLASQTPEALQAKDLLWDRIFTGLQQGGADDMLALLRGLMDETGATEGLPVMIREQARRAAMTRAAATRTQPRRMPRSRRRAR